MDRNTMIDGIMRSAGKGSEHQQIEFVHKIDGIRCYEPDDDSITIHYVMTTNTSELQKRIDDPNTNKYDLEYCEWDIERSLQIKEDWLKSKNKLS